MLTVLPRHGVVHECAGPPLAVRAAAEALGAGADSGTGAEARGATGAGAGPGAAAGAPDEAPVRDRAPGTLVSSLAVPSIDGDERAQNPVAAELPKAESRVGEGRPAE